MDFSTLLPLFIERITKKMIAHTTKLSFTIFSHEVLHSTPFHTHVLNKLIAITYQHMLADELQ